MKIKKIIHGVDDLAPFVGANLVADFCSNGCKGCYGKKVRREYSMLLTPIEIIDFVKKDKRNDGIIFGGLEWSEQIDDMLELIVLAVEKDLKIMIYTHLTLIELYAIIGKSVREKTKYSVQDNPLLSQNDQEIDSHIGALVLDKMITDEFYIKCGEFKLDKVVDDYSQFGVKLASSNQVIYKIESSKIGD